METTNVIEKVKNVQVLTSVELREKYLYKVNKGQICFIVMNTIPSKMLKKSRFDGTPNPFLDCISKHTEMSIIIGNDYETTINNNLEKEGKDRDFKSQKNTNGEHVGDSFVIYSETTKKYKLQYFINKRKDNSKPINYHCHYDITNDCVLRGQKFIKGQKLTQFEGEKLLNEFRSEEKKFSERSPNTQHKVENKVYCSNVIIENIEKITYNGTEYVVMN